MQKKIQLILLTNITLLFIGCGGGSGNESQETNNDISLAKGEFITCSDSTSFSVTPINQPSIKISKNIENGETTITLDEDSLGTVTIQNCIKV